MRRLAFAVILASVGALIPARAFQGSAASSAQAPQAAQRNDPQFRADINLVSVYATVVDSAGQRVPNLTKDDFLILDDGVPRVVAEFSNEVQPITVVMMLDRSVSLEAKFSLERSAAEAFVASLGSDDRARIGSFNSLIRIDPGVFTSDRDELIRILYLNLQDAGLSPLWNAAASAMNALVSQPGRRVVLLMSDGHDNTGLPGRHTMTYTDVRDLAVADDVMIYSVGVTNACGSPSSDAVGVGVGARRDDRRYDQRGIPPKTPPDPIAPPGRGPDNGGNTPNRPPIPIHDPNDPAGTGYGGGVLPGAGMTFPIDSLFGSHLGESRCTGTKPGSDLANLAFEGGGGYVEIHDGDDLRAVFSQIADELHHQYLLGFQIDKLDGHRHKLEVRTRDPKQHVWARRSYIAEKK